MTIDWTQEKKDEICKKIEAWITENHAFAGEIIMQNDNCIIEAPNLIAELVDEVIQPDYSSDDWDD